jgi:hypothetical protein
MTAAPIAAGTDAERAIRAAEQFLHSVVLVDDQIGAGTGSAEPAEGNDADRRQAQGEVATVSAPPTVGIRRPAAELELIAPPATAAAEAARTHGVDAVRLANAFAKRGIVCGPLQVSSTTELNAIALPAARRADVVVLDWILQPSGTSAEILAFIGELVASEKSLHRLRLVAIYTAERDLRGVVHNIATKLGENGASVGVDADGFGLQQGPLRVVAYSKTDLPLAEEDIRRRYAPEHELPDRLIADFALLTTGLVPRVAVTALTEVRAVTHRVLGNLTPSLDSAYLVHRAMQADPSDAEEHLVGLVADELRSILEDSEVATVAGAEACIAYVHATVPEAELSDRLRGQQQPLVSYADVDTLMTVGLQGDENWKGRWKKLLNPPQYQAEVRGFASSLASAQDAHERFAMLMALRTTYGDSAPRLRLGAILEEAFAATAGQTQTKYWLCLQAVCDSTRIAASRKFPLVPLVLVVNKSPFHVLVRNTSGVVVRLAAKWKLYELDLESFSPAHGTAAVEASEILGQDGRFAFTSEAGRTFSWLGELRALHAQRVANRYAPQTARVGVVESEWLRKVLGSRGLNPGED